MKALRFDGSRAALEDVSADARPGEALVRVVAAGVCNTDLEIVRGYASFRGTLGHEFVGVVETPGPSGVVPAGSRVVGEINCGCGACALCAAGDTRHCAGRTVLGIVGRDGALAEFVSLPEQNLVPLPSNIEDEAAVFIEPLAAACAIVEQVSIAPGMRVALVGDGKLGQLIARVLATTGASLTVFGRHESKLDLLASLPIDLRLSAEAGPESSASFDVVVEASGSAAGFAFAQRLVRPRGTIVLKSTIQGDVPFDAAALIVNEVTLVGSRCGRFRDAVAMLESGRVSLDGLVTRRMRLSDGPALLDVAAAPGVLKVVVRID